MAGETSRVPVGEDRLRWIMLALVFSAGMINYIDRQAIALLKPTLETAFGWDDRDYAHIVSAFQLATVASVMLAGWFVDKVGLRTGYAIGVGAWSAAGMAHALVTSVAGFVGVRVVLGVAEAVGTPAAVKSISTWFAGPNRSLALGVMNTAPNIGAVLTPLIVPLLAAVFGWRAAFIVTGALGFVWVGAWLMMPRPGRMLAEQTAISTPSAGAFRRMLADRRAWAIAIAKFLTDFVWAFMLFWAPDLFHKRYGLDTTGLALPIATIFLMAAAGSLFGGWLSSALLGVGRSANLSRKTPMLASALSALPLPLVLLAPNPWVGVLLVGLTLAAHQCFSTNVFGLATDLFPPRTVGLVIGFGAMSGSLSGLGMLEFTGAILDRTGSYAPMLILCAVAYATALLAIQILVPNVDRDRTSEAPVNSPSA